MKDRFDSNLSVENTKFDNKIKIYDVTKHPFKLYGNCKEAENIFARMPESFAQTVSEGVFDRAKRSAGVRLRFKTNSKRLGIKMKLSKALQFPTQTLISAKGFDIYIDNKYFCSVFAEGADTFNYEHIVDLGNSDKKDIIIYFPYNAVIDEFCIALDEDAIASEGEKYNIDVPVVFYGSSITHGFCVSRPGSTFTAMISRKLNSDYINLGFSGVCKGETAMAKYIATLKKSVFVCGFDHNAASMEELQKLHLPFYKKFREYDSKTPILFLSSPNSLYKGKGMYERMKIVEKTYKYAINSGDRNVYFLEGQTLYPEDIRDDCTVDAIHPNDLGAYMIAKKIYDELKKIIYTCDI